VTAGTEEEAQEGAAENRYLFLTATFDESQFPEPPEATDMTFLTTEDSLLTDGDREQKRIYEEYNRWEFQVKRGREASEKLNNRFADWYYVISAESFDKLNLSRSDLVVKKEESSS
jgi:hypothetical protein